MGDGHTHYHVDSESARTPSEAKFGVQSIFYYIFAAVVFLLPFSLVCAELASTYTKSGGLYRWVSEAFGPRWGWTAMFLEWMTIIIWFPTVLMFGAASLAYIFWPESFDQQLASNKIYGGDGENVGGGR